MQEKKKLSAKEILADTRAGATDDFLMKKYGLTEKGIQSLFKKLVDAKVMTQAELDQRESLHNEEVYEVSVEEIEEEKPTPSKPPPSLQTDGPFECPACGFSQKATFDECPGCGIVVSKYQRKTGKRRQAPKDAVDEKPSGSKVDEKPSDSQKDKPSKPPALWKAASPIGIAIFLFYWLFFMPLELVRSMTVVENFFFGGIITLIVTFIVWSVLRGIYWATTAMKGEK